MFFEEGEPLLDGEPGDLKFVLRTRPHARFQRAGNDLQHNLTISLVDALVGFSAEARSCRLSCQLSWALFAHAGAPATCVSGLLARMGEARSSHCNACAIVSAVKARPAHAAPCSDLCCGRCNAFTLTEPFQTIPTPRRQGRVPARRWSTWTGTRCAWRRRA